MWNNFLYSAVEDGGAIDAKAVPIPQYEDEDPVEVVVVNSEKDIPDEDPDKDLPDDVKNQSKTDLYNRLAKQQSSTEVITETLGKGFDDLSKNLAVPKNVNQVVEPKSKLTMTERKANLNKNIWEKDFANTLDVYLDARNEPLMAKFKTLEQENFNTMATVLKKDPDSKDILNNRQDEIGAMLATYSPEYQRNPQVLVEVIEKIKQKDYASNPSKNPAFQSKVDDAVAKRLKELGVEDPGMESANVPNSVATHTASNSRGTPKVRKVFIPRHVHEAALEQGADPVKYYEYIKGNR